MNSRDEPVVVVGSARSEPSPPAVLPRQVVP